MWPGLPWPGSSLDCPAFLRLAYSSLHVFKPVKTEFLVCAVGEADILTAKKKQGWEEAGNVTSC